MYTSDSIDTVRPDHPAESALHVRAHCGDVEFVELTSITGPDEDWCVQLSWDQAETLAAALRLALTRIDRRRAEVGTRTQRQVENTVGVALADAGQRLDWEAISDAVDVHLGRFERENGQQLDRDAIPREAVQAVRDAIVLDAQAHRA
jgi:hypothetical protein